MPSHHAAVLREASPPSPRWRIARIAGQQGGSNLRRDTVDRLSNSQQYRLRQLHHRIATRRHTLLRPRGSGVSPSDTAAPDNGPPAARWKPAMKEVILGNRSTDAIIDRDQFKSRKYTYCHGIKMKKSSKAKIGNTTALENKCLSCIGIVENATREAAQRQRLAEIEREALTEVVHGAPSADPDNRTLADYTKAASADHLSLVFGMFHSLPELDKLDSIYKERLFFEMRIRRFAAGSTVFRQWENHTMVCVVLQGCVQLSSKHTGVSFQAGVCSVGEVVGSVTPSIGHFTARCTEATTLLCLDCDRLSTVVNDSASAERIAKKNLLKHCSVFSTLTDEDLNTLEALFTTVTLDDNQVLCKEGFRIDHVYVVKRGFLRVFKAFLAEDGHRPRPPSQASAKAPITGASRRSLTASSTRKTVNNGSEPAKGGVRLMHFDLGEIGACDILGENGVIQQAERLPSAPASSLPSVLLNREPSYDDDPEQELEEPGAHPLTSSSSAGDAQGERDSRVLSGASAKDSARATGIPVRPSRAAYFASAAASGGTAEVYAAKVHELKKMQTKSFRYSWKTAQRLHHSREQAWSASELARQLLREQEWGALRRETVLEALAIKS